MPYSPDDFLNALQNGSQGFAAATGNIRQQAALQALTQAGPGLIAQGDLGSVASLAAGAGDMSLLRELLQQKLKPASSSGPTAQDVLNVAPTLGLNLTPDQAQSYSAFGNTAASILTSNKQNQQFGENIGLQRSEEQRRVDQQKTEHVSKIQEGVTKQTEKLRGTQEAINNLLSVGPEKLAAADRLLMLGINKTIGKDVGNTAVQEAQGIVPNTLFGTFQDVVNFVLSKDYSKLPDDTKQHLLDVIGKQGGNIQDQINERARRSLEQSLNTRRKYIESNGQLDPGVISIAENHGLEIKKQKDGIFKVLPQGQAESGQNASGPKSKSNTKESVEAVDLNVIKNPELKAKVAGLIPGKSVDAVKKIIQNALLIESKQGR